MKRVKQNLDQYFKSNDVITTKQAEKLSIGRNELSIQVRKGSLVRLERGVYAQNSNILFDSLGAFVPILLKIPAGVICLISALKYYDLTEEMGEEKWIAIPNEKIIKPFSNVKIIRLRGMNYSTGIDVIKYKKYTLKIYDKEKTIIDSFKYLSRDIALKALREYLKRKDRNIQKLIGYGKKLRSNLTDTITTLVTI